MTPEPVARRTAEDELREQARLLLRAGLTSPEETQRELADAIARELPRLDPAASAREWLAAAHAALWVEQQAWPLRTDHDALTEVFAECEAIGVRVLRGVPDHWSAKSELERLTEHRAQMQVRGVLWFTPPDVWHAIDEGMLEVNLWHADTANAAPGDALLDDVLAVFAAHEVTAHFDEGRIEVAAHWRRRL